MMTTLEEEIVLPLKRQMEVYNGKNGSGSSKPRLFWKYFLIAGCGILYGIILSGLVLMERHSSAELKKAMGGFEWLVLAEGDTVAIDEVGAYLRKLDGVGEVTFVSADDVLEKVKQDPLLSSDLDLLAANPFPASWKVRWKPAEFDLSHIQSSLEDVRLFPGVVDIASDPRALEKIESERARLQRLEHTLVLALLVSGLFALVYLVRFLFFRSTWRFDNKAALAGTGVFLLALAAGFASVFFTW